MVIRGDGILCVPTAAASGCDPGGSSGSAWSDGAWDQFTSGLSDDIYILGVGGRGNNSTNANEFEMDIGVGGSGSEVVVITLAGYVEAGGDEPIIIMVEGQELVRVPASTAISARLRTSGTSLSCFPKDLKLIYCKCIDLVPL